MAFKMSTQKVTGTVNVVEIGTGDKAIKLGGEQVLPFYSFDGETGNAPVVGAEISDIQPAEWIDCYSKIYGDVWADPAKWAKYVEDNTEADFICLRFNGASPDGAVCCTGSEGEAVSLTVFTGPCMKCTACSIPDADPKERKGCPYVSPDRGEF